MSTPCTAYAGAVLSSGPRGAGQTIYGDACTQVGSSVCHPLCARACSFTLPAPGMAQHDTMDLLRAFLRAWPCRPIQAMRGCQNTVWLVARDGQRLVVKLRHAQRARRLEKEWLWLQRAQGWGIAVPRIHALQQHHEVHALILKPIPSGPRRSWHPQAILSSLAPLHAQPAGPGWGPLRLDGRPRWSRDGDALTWYLNKARSTFPEFAELPQALEDSWQARVAGLIHGDLHRANCPHGWLLDWEHVACGDPYEDAARLAWDRRWPRPERWLGGALAAERWRGALLRTGIEGAAVGRLAVPTTATVLRSLLKQA